MGPRPSGANDLADEVKVLPGIGREVEARQGKLAFAVRYHEPPTDINDDYELSGTVIGTGCSGQVVLATCKCTSAPKKFAVKSFDIDRVPMNKWAQLESEVKIFLCMDHPNITRLIDVYRDDQNLHMVMEYMAGGELFDRLTKMKRFQEEQASDSMAQILLALNYIHSFGIAHRDVKLENFLYEEEGGHHLKLIDFGFSDILSMRTSIFSSCGTLAYVAPEVLQRKYTTQCDMWSAGVIAFILLAGTMPFYGTEQEQLSRIATGSYHFKPQRWEHVSDEAKDFIRRTLKIDPKVRLTAQQALRHPFIDRSERAPVDLGIVRALQAYAHSPPFRRTCLKILAWSASNEEITEVGEDFLAMDLHGRGTITRDELKQCLVGQCGFSEAETSEIFESLDGNKNDRIHYSDFIAAMISAQSLLHEDLLRTAFRKFDTDRSGCITEENLRAVLESRAHVPQEEIHALLGEADFRRDGVVSYEEFVRYIQGDACDEWASTPAKTRSRWSCRTVSEWSCDSTGVPVWRFSFSPRDPQGSACFSCLSALWKLAFKCA